EYLADGQQGAKDVHENHLSRIVAEMLAIKRHDHLGLIRFKAPFHHSGERAIGAVLEIVWDIERGEPHIRVFPERTGIEEAPGLQKIEPVFVTRHPQVLTIKLMRPPGIIVARGSVIGMIRQKSDEITRSACAYSAAAEPQRCARPIGVALIQQRQIEEPFAWIVNYFQLQRSRTAADPTEQSPEGPGGNETDINFDFTDVGGAGRPVRGTGRHALDISPVGKSR